VGRCGARNVICLGRVYMGAQLPLDLLGGGAFGWAIGSLVNLFLGFAPLAPMNHAHPHRDPATFGTNGIQPHCQRRDRVVD
jgi:hypothetical protein